MAFETYRIDRIAHDLVRDYYQSRDAMSQSHKMRMTVAYGLERFWGEQYRLDGVKADYWKATWDEFAKMMDKVGISIPNDEIDPNQPDTVKSMTDKLWAVPLEHRKVALAVLTQLCGSLVWWTQRYKKLAGGSDDE
ncbi:MAG: hypothetical protein WBA24_06575 [Geitlerinemataceae cyanobacterium]